VPSGFFFRKKPPHAIFKCLHVNRKRFSVPQGASENVPGVGDATSAHAKQAAPKSIGAACFVTAGAQIGEMNNSVEGKPRASALSPGPVQPGSPGSAGHAADGLFYRPNDADWAVTSADVGRIPINITESTARVSGFAPFFEKFS
jgi:hypothetical protein